MAQVVKGGWDVCLPVLRVRGSEWVASGGDEDRRSGGIVAGGSDLHYN